MTDAIEPECGSTDLAHDCESYPENCGTGERTILPALVPPDADELPPVPHIGRPDQLLPPARWIENPSASAMSIHLSRDANPDGSPDMQRLRGRILLALAWPGQTLVALLHPEHATAIAQGLASCVQAALEPPRPAPASPAGTDAGEGHPASNEAITQVDEGK